MSIQLRQTAETMIEKALATTGKSACGTEGYGCARIKRAIEREARFFEFHSEARLDAGRIRGLALRDRVMA